MNNFVFSIIVPIYNVESYLRICIDSILLQKYQCFELLLIDDGSTDTSSEICRDYSEKYSNIKYVKKENGGVSSSRNVGLSLAKGQYIIFADSDDVLFPDALAIYYKAIIDYNPDVIKGGYIKEYWNGKKECFIAKKLSVIYNHSEMIHETRSNGYEGFVWNTVYKRSLLNGLFFDETMNYLEDHVFTCQYYARCNSMLILNFPVYKYQIRQRKSLSSLHDPFKMLDATAKLFNARLKVIADSDKDGKIKAECMEDIIIPVNWALQTVYFSQSSYKERKKFVTYLKENNLETADSKLFFNEDIPFEVVDLLMNCVMFYRRVKRKLIGKI